MPAPAATHSPLPAPAPARLPSRSSLPAHTAALVPGIVLAALCNRPCEPVHLPPTFASPLPPWALPAATADSTLDDSTPVAPLAATLSAIRQETPETPETPAREAATHAHEAAEQAIDRLLECIGKGHTPSIPAERRIARCAVQAALQTCEEGDDVWCATAAERTVQLAREAGPSPGNRFEQLAGLSVPPAVVTVEHARHLLHQRVRALPLFDAAMRRLEEGIDGVIGNDPLPAGRHWTGEILQVRVQGGGEVTGVQYLLKAVGLELGRAFEAQTDEMFQLQPGLLDARGRAAMKDWGLLHLPSETGPTLTPVQARHLWSELAHWLNLRVADAGR